MMTDTGREFDALILPYLLEKDEEAARRRLGELVSQQADPIIRGVIARQARTDAGRRATAGRRQEAEEVQEETVVQLVARLEALRGEDHARADDSIPDLRSYVAGLALRNFQSWLRRMFPRRAWIRNRLRYLLSHDARFLIRPSADAGWLCGLSDRDVPTMRRGGRQGLPDEGPAPAEAPGAPEAAGSPALSADPSAADLAALAWDLLARAGRPLDLEFLVDAVARRCGLDEAPDRRGADGPGGARPAGRRPAVRTVPEAPRDHRDHLKRIWEEILLLPPLQRSVLLLGLRDARGHGLIGLFPVTGVAGIRRIAIALGMLPDRFAELWKDLPLDDAAIAARLRLSRTHVTDLRRAALERLARRIG